MCEKELCDLECLIVDYVKANGSCESLVPDLMELYVTDEQFKEAVDNNYELFTYDEWAHFQKFIGRKLSFEKFVTISSLLYEEDIDVIELPYGRRADF